MIARWPALARSLVGAAAIAFWAFAGAAADEDQAEPDNREALDRREAVRLIQAELPHWQIKIGNDQKPLNLEAQPVLRWTNPATSRVYGEIYVWTNDGRPEGVMSLYRNPDWGFMGEFKSLSLVKLIGERDRAVAWKSDQPGIELRDVPEAPAAAEAPARRLRQMRDIAADFSVVLTDRRRNPEGERQNLRLLTNPVHRYASPGGGVADGAIFAYVVGTDPEALLLLEARGKEDETRWQHAVARMNRDELAASYKDRAVWRAERVSYLDRDQPYVLMHFPAAPPRRPGG